MENLRKGVKEFLLKFSSPTSLSANALPMDGNFVTFISVHEGSEGAEWVRKYLSENEWTGRVVLVTDNNNDHYNAMASSDFGFIFDGQMVSSANALHLPNNCLINMRMHQQFYHDFFNRWWNDMNIVADNHINKELIGGEAWWGKICDTLASNYVKPEARSHMIQLTKGFIQDGMSFKPIDREVVRTKDLTIDGQTYDQYYDPFQLTARNMLTHIDAYQMYRGQSEGLRVFA